MASLGDRQCRYKNNKKGGKKENVLARRCSNDWSLYEIPLLFDCVAVLVQLVGL